MNERIKELLNEATVYALHETKDAVDFLDNPVSKQQRELQLEKFAELIIRDCMHDCLRMQLGKQYTPEELLFQTKYRKIIKEHFGVE